jgi:hypothetical protein
LLFIPVEYAQTGKMVVLMLEDTGLQTLQKLCAGYQFAL